MSMASSGIRDLARRLIALEAARGDPAVVRGLDAVRVCERLRHPLSKLTGVAGFRSLMSRALALAKAEIPTLSSASVLVDGSLEGLDGPGIDQKRETSSAAGISVVAQLLGLLITFIGEPLTLRILSDAWPDAPVAGVDVGSEDGQ